MRTPLVSIIVPVYNTEKYLMDTIRTIQKQTLSDFEVICVDDGSTDRTLAILDKVSAEDRRFSVLRQKNAGAGAARNYGFTVARGKYAIFLDSGGKDNYSQLRESTRRILLPVTLRALMRAAISPTETAYIPNGCLRMSESSITAIAPIIS